MIRRCNECDEEWDDDGDYECPFCGSEDTYVVTEESNAYETEEMP